MTAPVGTYLARVREGSMALPGAMVQYAAAEGWTLFEFVVIDRNRVRIQPVMPDGADELGDYQACLGPDGKLWIPLQLREEVELKEQSVMLRVEDGAITMYLRKVFETLGFRPG